MSKQKLSETQVLDYLRTHENVTRQELARAFDASEGTVNRVMADLTRKQIVWCVGLAGTYHYEMARIK